MRLTILPDNLEVDVQEGETIFQAIEAAGITMNSSCGKKGTCGRCAVDLVSGNVDMKNLKKVPRRLGEGQVLSCQTIMKSDIVIRIPHDGRRLTKHKVLVNEINLENPFVFNPLFQRHLVSLSPPSLTENGDDLSRLQTQLRRELGVDDTEISLRAMRQLSAALRRGDWQVSVGLAWKGSRFEIIDVIPPGEDRGSYGLAVDIGTTTVKVALVDLANGKVLASEGDYNRQQKHGDDVISRIIYSNEGQDAIEELRQLALASINDVVRQLLSSHGLSPREIYAAVVSGNTTMIHLFLGIPAKNLRLEPYIPSVAVPPCLHGEETGLLVNPGGVVYFMPSVASYVGGDITSGALATGISSREDLQLFIDIGTNGEMVLGNSDWLVSCACSAGPCFEGGGIKCGMRAMDGAIDKVEINADFDVRVNTVNNKKPAGICGSGLIDAVGTMLRQGIINRSGEFERNLFIPRLRQDPLEGYEFVLVWSRDTDHGEDIVIQEADIKNVIRAKAAIFAGMRSLLHNVGLSFDDVIEVMIAGGFGNSLNIHDAVTIGMLPGLPVEKFRYVGNSSIKGAEMVLTSREAWERVIEVARGMTYIELSVGTGFMEEFVSASFLPHTDLSLFPEQGKDKASLAV